MLDPAGVQPFVPDLSLIASIQPDGDVEVLEETVIPCGPYDEPTLVDKGVVVVGPLT